MCLGKCQHSTDAMVRWERQILEVVGTHEYPQLHDIAEEPVDVDWKIHPDHAESQRLGEITNMFDNHNIAPSEF